jgi:hypothetical protein
MAATTHPINCDCDTCELDTLGMIAELSEADTREGNTMKTVTVDDKGFYTSVENCPSCDCVKPVNGNLYCKRCTDTREERTMEYTTQYDGRARLRETREVAHYHVFHLHNSGRGYWTVRSQAYLSLGGARDAAADIINRPDASHVVIVGETSRAVVYREAIAA